MTLPVLTTTTVRSKRLVTCSRSVRSAAVR